MWLLLMVMLHRIPVFGTAILLLCGQLLVGFLLLMQERGMKYLHRKYMKRNKIQKKGESFMKRIKRICFIGLLFLLPIVGICQSYGNSVIDGLKSGDALTVQYAQDIILIKWGQHYWGQRNFEKERIISELINIIETDSTKVDTFTGYSDEQRKEKILS